MKFRELFHQTRLKYDTAGALETGNMVGLFVGMSLAIVVATYLYVSLLGPTIANALNVSSAQYIGASAGPLLSAVTIFYFLAVMVLPVIVVMHIIKE